MTAPAGLLALLSFGNFIIGMGAFVGAPGSASHHAQFYLILASGFTEVERLPGLAVQGTRQPA